MQNLSSETAKEHRMWIKDAAENLHNMDSISSILCNKGCVSAVVGGNPTQTVLFRGETQECIVYMRRLVSLLESNKSMLRIAPDADKPY